MQKEIVGATSYTVERSAVGAPHTDMSGVLWAAIFAGAAVAAALSLGLVVHSVGFGLSTISPLVYAGAGVLAMSVSTVIWLAVTQNCIQA